MRKWQAAFARQAVRNGWNGIYLDSMGLYAFNGFTGTPINPRTGKPFTSAGWLKATTGLAKAVNAAVPVRVMVNGLRTGPGYWKGTRVLLAGAQAGEFEGCFRDATSGISHFPSLDSWKATVKALIDIQARGRHAMCWTKTWTSASERPDPAVARLRAGLVPARCLGQEAVLLLLGLPQGHRADLVWRRSLQAR